MTAITLLCAILAASNTVHAIGLEEIRIATTENALFGCDDPTDTSGTSAVDTCQQTDVDISCSQAEGLVSTEETTESTFVPLGVDVPFSQARGPSHFHAGFSRASFTDRVTRFEGRRFEEGSNFLVRRLRLKTRSARRSFLALFGRDTAFQTPLVCKYSSVLSCGRKTLRTRTADGSCNNIFLDNRAGQAGRPFRRFIAPCYSDGVGEPQNETASGKPLPSARDISRIVHPDSGVTNEAAGLTHMIMQWAQWMDHDLGLTPMVFGEDGSELNCCENDFTSRLNLLELNRRGLTEEQIVELVNLREGCFPIRFPSDPRFGTCMNFIRSLAATPDQCHLSSREQQNGITSYIDSSNIYGSSKERQLSLRQLTGGLLKVQNNPGGGDLLPSDVEDESPCVVDTSGEVCFRAGDVRSNEFVGLSAFHTLWVREHNRVARELSALNPLWGNDRLFEETRRIIIAFNQHINYKEWLPIILGPDLVSSERFDLLPQLRGFFLNYQPFVPADIRNAFATAAFRMGHSYINSQLTRVDENYQTTGFSPLVTGSHFFRPGPLFDDARDGPDSILRGLLVDRVQGFDRFVTTEVTERLFEDRFSGTSQIALDLVALNIQRGRDHGLPSYKAFRNLCRLPTTFTDFSQLPDHDITAQKALASAYTNVNDIELFTGGLSEKPLEGSLIGPTFGCILAAQFRLLKVGDRFYYENRPSLETQAQGFATDELAEIRKVTLSRILCNSGGALTIQPRSFETADTTGNGRIDCSRIAQPNLKVFDSRKAR